MLRFFTAFLFFDSLVSSILRIQAPTSIAVSESNVDYRFGEQVNFHAIILVININGPNGDTNIDVSNLQIKAVFVPDSKMLTLQP